MPAFSPMGEYKLTATQVDLILYCLDHAPGLTIDEDNERRKLYDTFSSCGYVPGPFKTQQPPYDNLCDI